MAQIMISDRIRIVLKNIRRSSSLSGSELSSKIGKGAAYISQIESGKIKKIDFAIFQNILDATINDDDKKNSILKDTVLNKEFYTSKKEDKMDTVFKNMDTVQRLIPVSRSLVTCISDMITELKITTKELSDYINRNEEIANSDDIDCNSRDFQKNVWFCHNGESSIILDIEAETIDRILKLDIEKSNYVTVYAIIYHLLKLQGLNKEDARVKATDLLNKEKFYSLTERNKLLENAKEEDIPNILSEFDIENMKLGRSIVHKLQAVSEQNVSYANKIMSVADNNLGNDPGLTLALWGIDLTPMREQSLASKKDLVKAISNLIIESSKKESKLDLLL